jgi:hypothetical protein
MTNILTAAEGAAVLRVASNDADMLALLPLVDAYIKSATGRNWAAETAIRAEAKAAARMLLVQWYENPSGQAAGIVSLEHGLNAALLQLEAIALQIREIVFTGSNGAGACSCPGTVVGDQVQALVAITGGTGSATTSFASVITVADEIQQISASDLSAVSYLVYLKSPTIRDYPA